ncbi:MAG: AAA family ATPase, partial [Acidobacteria bacterium]|nr:AAA family ATPase [Acidobacteriota bacterium]
MKSFPVFRRLRVQDFGLYPGREGGEKGLHIDFHPGLTLAVGANGLGKTTLTTLLFRMLSGPNDIPQLSAGTDLGFRRLETRPLRPNQRKAFAARVSDGAATATAHLELTLGSNAVSVERRLSDLALKNAQIGGVACTSESTFQSLVAKAAGLGSFGDFILVLRYLVFYFEDRRQLVWDPSAQRQLLRILFLPPDLAQSWTAQERSILENDSRMRNFQAVLGKEEGLLAQSLEKQSSAPDLRAELEMLEKLQEPDRLRLGELEGLTSDLDRIRQNARRAHLQAKQEREVRLRAVEHAKFLTIDARFPTPEEAGRYVLAHLLSENRCLACGEQATQSARQYAARLTSNRCVVCDRPLPRSDQIV